MILFSQRKKIATEFEKWCKDNSIPCCAVSMMGFLQGNDLLDEDKLLEYLNTVDIPNSELNGLQEFTNT